MSTVDATSVPVRLDPLRRRLCRPLPALLVVVGVLWAASLLLDTTGYLGTDTGGKVATLEAMASRPIGTDPDVGYWAADQDPSGALHGLVYTVELDGRYVNVTTLPMVELGAPLYRVGGYRLALLLPILGCAAAAFAARALAGRLGGDDRRSWVAFWIVALGSPLVVYALDFWEHAPGVALVLWGVVAMIDAAEGRRVATRALLAGAAFGAAYAMRTEALVYGFTATAVALAWCLADRRFRRAAVVGVGALVGVVALAGANLVLESAVLGSSFRAGRASGTAGSGGEGLGLRLKEAVLTTVGTTSSLALDALVLGGITMGLALLLMVLLARRSRGRAVVLVGVALGILVLSRLTEGPGFVPGFLAASPLAVLGLAVVRPLWGSPSVRYVTAVAVGALPLVWYFQYTGGAGPQWGGRYVLVSAVLLTVVGVVGIDLLTRRAAVGVLVASVVVSWLGAGWLVVRSHEVGEAGAYVAARDEPVVISTEPFWLRELAAHRSDSRWMSVGSRAELDAAASIAADANFDSLALIELRPPDAPLQVPGYEPTSSETKIWLDEPFRITSYERSP